MPKNNGYTQLLQRELLKQKIIDENERVNSIFKTRAQTLDCVTITLGKMGLNPDDLAYFEDLFCQVENDYMDTVSEETSEAPKNEVEQALYLSAEKDKIDRLLRQYVRADRFKSYDERFKNG